MFANDPVPELVTLNQEDANKEVKPMLKRIMVLIFLLLLASTSLVYSEGKLTIHSNLDADLYVNDVKQASVNTADPFILQIKEPGTYKIELRTPDQSQVHQEEVTLIPETGLEKTIRAFENVAPVEETAKEPDTSAEPGITRAELKSEVAKAKAEALAEEAARRKRQADRELGKKAVIHVIGVETQRMPSGVKNLERIKLLGELIPNIKK